MKKSQPVRPVEEGVDRSNKKIILERIKDTAEKKPLHEKGLL